MILRELKSNKEQPSYKICDNPKGTAAVWQRFGIVCDAMGVQQNFEACKSCKCVYVYKTGINATSTNTINKHVCDNMVPDAGKGNLFFKKHNVTVKEKVKMTQSMVNFCTTDMRPFEAVAGKGLKAVIQDALDIGVASSARIDVDDLLAHPVSIRRNAESRAASGRAALTVVLKQHLENGVGVSCTLDLWTD
ncbi:hypothetical protein AeMF1_020564 [Aphanomyces euteiches]|nr:hypothetical protein AeMF1_020564 [Aphanomyces euteiches]KAH9187438.1 hypothetical protein AeNC1_010586 [Aphanomyces euteiches]